MRINKTNSPMLGLLKWHERLAASPLAKTIVARSENAQKVMAVIDYQWPRLVHLFSKRIDIVSHPFMTAAFANADKIGGKENIELLLNDGPLSGTLVAGKYVTFYSFDVRDDWNESVIICFYGDLLAFVSMNSAKIFYADPRQEGVELKTYQEVFRQIQIAPYVFNLFKKYADVETIDAKMGKKVAIPDTKDKLLVEFDLPMTYTDCSWFREIVRKEGFMVSGHFRLQWYPSRGEHRLIYIEPFQKHGYTRRAKIDRQAEQ